MSADRDLELYKFYLDLVLKLGVFIFGVSGVIVSYVLAHADRCGGTIRLALAVPLVMNLGFSAFCFLFYPSAKELRKAANKGALGDYELRPLEVLVWMSGALYALSAVAIGIIYAYARGE